MSHLIYSLLKAFENPTGLERPLIRDISSHQGKYNMLVALANGVLWITMRAAIGWSYQDKFFPGYWPDAEGIYRNSYLVIHPDLDVTRQADNWYRVNPEIEVIPRTIDLEVNKQNLAATQIADAVWKMSEIVLASDGVRPIIYSRYLLVNSWLASWTTEMLNDHYWWLAQYRWDRHLEHPGPPTLPDRLRKDRVILHQTADKKPGFFGEAESEAVDYNRWELGSAVDMVAFIDEVWGGHASPPPVDKLADLRRRVHNVVDVQFDKGL